MQRNPYLILGIPFATHRDDARRAFALAAKRLRSNGDGPYSVEDLTWALQEIDSLERDPSTLVDHYRVPADPSAFHVDGTGLFRPPARAMARRTAPADPTALAIVRGAAMQEVIELIIYTFSSGLDFDSAFDE